MSTKHVIEVPDKIFHRTDELTSDTLWDHKVLAHEPQECDRSYQHSNFDACATGDLRDVVRTSEKAIATPLKATRTWKQQDGVWHARFCKHEYGVKEGHAAFLSPYFGAHWLQDTQSEIQRCHRFKVCPTIEFVVRGQLVPRRKVLVWNRDENEAQSFTRSYCSLDAARCGSPGYMVQYEGVDCRDAAKTKKCRVDRLASPLMSVVFCSANQQPCEDQEGSSDDDSLLKRLKEYCPYAFTETLPGFDGTGVNLFSKMRQTLVSEYSADDDVTKKLVLDSANALTFAVFGVSSEKRGLHERRSDSNSPKKTPFDVYTEQGKCAMYIAQSMKRLHDKYSSQEFIGLNYQIDENRDESPGNSLYLFSERVAMFMPIRWLMQCVVWASPQDGGVPLTFVRNVLTARIFEKPYPLCDNWKESLETRNAPASITLKKRLLTARQIFTVDETTNADHAIDTQMVRDVHTSVVRALDAIGVRDRPDFWCLKYSEDPPKKPQPTFNHINSDQFIRFADDQYLTKTVNEYDTTVVDQKIGNIISEVRRELVGEAHKDNFMQLTLSDLIKLSLVTKRSENLEGSVMSDEINWPMFEFEALKSSKNHETPSDNSESYTKASTRCSKAGGWELVNHEYSLTGKKLSTCLKDTDLFSCKTLENNIYGGYLSRIHLKQPFLRSSELLTLVLKLLRRFMLGVGYKRHQDLHIPLVRVYQQARSNEQTLASDWSAIMELFQDMESESEDPLRLTRTHDVDTSMKIRSDAGVECSPDQEYEKGGVTNTQHQLLRICFEQLKEEVGWILDTQSTHLEIPVHAALLLKGFYPAFEEVVDENSVEDDHPEYFLSKMLRDAPGEPLPGEDICFKRSIDTDDSEVVQIHPFWGDFFDVAHTGDTSALEAKGCDIKRSSADNSIFLYSTLCAETSTSGSACENHKNYLEQVRTYLPPECETLHGKRVYREHIGAVSGTPLCERRPSASKMSCEASQNDRKYGLLHGKKGVRISNLDNYENVEFTQQGLWQKQNSLFRANSNEEAYVNKEHITALQLLPTDIGGHSLGFKVNKEGVMRLHSASMRSNPENHEDVRTWLSYVEDDFADSHFLYEYVNSVKTAGDVSWRCPLHWLQTYSDGDGFDQARAPAYQRNAARFMHITGEKNRYAHPTVRNSDKIKGLTPALFLNDALACVGQTKECHGFGLLKKTVNALVANEWRIVEYVGEDCTRLLDWPEELVTVRL